MSRKALLAGLIEQHPGLPAELAKVAVAANLTILVAESGISRSDLAKKLGWSRARVSQVLSGEGNLTIETIHAVARAVGAGFDVVFRKAGESAAKQPWEKQVGLAFQVEEEPDLTSWMSRKTMPLMRTRFAGAHEFVNKGMTLQSSNHEMMQPEVPCAA